MLFLLFPKNHAPPHTFCLLIVLSDSFDVLVLYYLKNKDLHGIHNDTAAEGSGVSVSHKS